MLQEQPCAAQRILETITKFVVTHSRST